MIAPDGYISVVLVGWSKCPGWYGVAYADRPDRPCFAIITEAERASAPCYQNAPIIYPNE